MPWNWRSWARPPQVDDVHPLARLHLRNLRALGIEIRGLVEGQLWAKILIGMVLGIGVGLLLGPGVGRVPPRTATLIAEWLALPGQLFLSAIQMVVLPLIVASVIRGMAASGDPEQLKRTGAGLAMYFVLTTLAATAIGVIVASVVQPGRFISPEVRSALVASAGQPAAAVAAEPGGLASLPAGLVSLLPSNPLHAMVQGEMLQVVLFSIVVGAALISIEPESSKPIFDLLGSVQRVSMKVVAFVMRLAPYAVFGLLAQSMSRTGVGLLASLGIYVALVVGGLLVLLLVYLGIVRALGRHPWQFLTAIREPQLLAFSTDSSAATMPVTLKTAEERLGIRPSISQLVIPLGATVNMGGTALYHGVATIFLAQLFDMSLAPSSLAALLTTSLAASLGAPATPGVGIIVLATVLTSAGVPLAGLSLIIGFDQILERLRAAMNVSGDLVAAAVMDRFVGGPESAEAERARAEEMDALREQSRADVIVTSGTAPRG